MRYYESSKTKKLNTGMSHGSYSLLDANNGCVNGCCTGISIYGLTEYSTPGIHDDQEGFCVLEGMGYAKVGDQEFRLEPETSFIAPAGVPHTIKRDQDSKPVKVFWFHSAV